MTSPFDRTGFFNLLDACMPNAAKALLEQAIGNGGIHFPAGTCQQMGYRQFIFYIDVHTDIQVDDFLSLENKSLLATYGSTCQSSLEGSLDTQAFPLAFAYDMLNRSATGEHPLFYKWMRQTLAELLPEQDRAGTYLDRSKEDWTATLSDPDWDYLVPPDEKPAPTFLHRAQISYPFGVS